MWLESWGDKRELVASLDDYQRYVAMVPRMRLGLLPLDIEVLLASREIRRGTGLLIMDSLSVAVMTQGNISAIATSDGDFRRIPSLEVYAPELR